MKCDNCYNYQECPSGVDQYMPSACVAKLDRKTKELVFDEKIECPEYRRID